ncbi:divergent polysaccharide deacetylase family protein [bacterium]|nr:divergent polysaccharide deacetylase family protein [bacterium]
MPASRKTDPSALQTGLGHFALSILTFGVAASALGGAAAALGDASDAAPVVEYALFDHKDAAAPYLKARTDAGALVNHAAEPSLGVDYDPDADAGARPVTITITDLEQGSLAPAALPRAPILGFFERTPSGDLPRIAADGSTPAQAYARPFVSSGQPRVSLIIGGLGLNATHTLAAINELPPEVTLSFVPYSNNLQTWINRARAAGHEVLLELPMEPYDYPNVDTGPQTLLTSASTGENLRRLNLLLGKATGYFGVTNYQGAKFATDERAAAPIMKSLNERGLVFVHDGAAARSSLPEAAESAGLSFAAADRIIDAEASADAIDRQLLELEALALQNGSAVGVGFAYPVTVEQLQQWAAGLKTKGYELAPASQAVGVTALSLGDAT